MGEPIPQSPDEEFERLVARAEELTLRFERHPTPAVREDVLELLQTIDTIHRGAIFKFVELVIESGNHELIHRAAEDPQVSTILQLYDVLPLPVLARWQELLDTVRPRLKENSADVELIRVVDEMPYLRLKGAFMGDESDLRQLVQDSIATALGGYQSVKWELRERPPAPSKLVPISAIKPAKRQYWIDLLQEGDVAVGEVRKLEVRQLEVVLGRSTTGYHAFPNACPGSALPLHMGVISNNKLICPWHSCSFDLRSGKRDAGVGPDLKPLVLRIEAGSVQLGLWE